MKMDHGLKTLVLKLSLILIYFFSFNLSAKTLKVDTVTPSVTDGDFTIQKDGTGDIVLGSDSGFGVLTSGVLSTQASIDLSTDVSGVAPIASGGTNSSTALLNDLVMISSGGSIIESSTTATELGFLDATSSIQTQLDGTVKTTGNQSIAGDKTVTGQFVATSTTNGNRPCPVMTEVQRDAISAPSEGDCVVNSTASELNYYLDGEWAQVGGGGGGSGNINILSDPSFEKEELTYTCTTVSGSGSVSQVVAEYSDDEDLKSPNNLKYHRLLSGVGIGEPSGATINCDIEATRNNTHFINGIVSGFYKTDDPFLWCPLVDGDCIDDYIPLNTENVYRKFEAPVVLGDTDFGIRIRIENYTGAFEFRTDNLNIGTQPDGYIQSINDSDTDFIAYTPTFTGFGTLSDDSFRYKRVGDSIIVEGNFVCGTPTTSEAQIGLPNSLEINQTGSSTVVRGTYAKNNGEGVTTAQGGFILTTDGDTYLNMGNANTIKDTGGGDTIDNMLPVPDNNVCASGQRVSFTTTQIPIEGWQTGRVDAFSQRKELTAETANELSAHIDNGSGGACTTGTCTTSRENYNWLTTCTRNSSGNYTCSFESGVFTEIPNCRATPEDTANYGARVTSPSTSSIGVIIVGGGTPYNTDSEFNLFCSRSTDVNKSITVDGTFDVKQMQQKCQTKFLPSDVSSSTDPVTSLGFSNLSVGNTYEIFVNYAVNADTDTTPDIEVYNNSNLVARAICGNGGTDTVRCMGTASGKFTAESSSVVVGVDVGGSSFFFGNGTKNETHITLCEAPKLIETTEWN